MTPASMSGNMVLSLGTRNRGGLSEEWSLRIRAHRNSHALCHTCLSGGPERDAEEIMLVSVIRAIILKYMTGSH